MNQNDEITGNKNAIDVDDLIIRTRNEDKRNSRLMKSVFYLYLFCSVLYTLLFVINPDPDLTRFDRLAGLCYVSAFVTGTFFFRKEYKALKNVAYAVPLLQLLQQNEVRYRFFSYKWWYVALIVMLIGAGLSISFTDPVRFGMFTTSEKLVLIHGIYWSVLTISGFIGYRIWKKRSWPIWKDSKALLKELES
ncbi:MAG: hypothetical protein V1775_06855 [Bacteroidota bacterium]